MAKSKKTADNTEVKLHELVKNCQPVKVLRSQINFAPYNPRVMSDKARKRLGSGIEKFGLVETPTWNIRTGNLVGDHQRVKALDKISKEKDFYLWVVQVDLDEKSERELNILLNNPEAQGDYDMEKLKDIFKDDKIKIEVENTGFDEADMFQFFGEASFEDKSSDELVKLSENLSKVHEAYDKQRDQTEDRDRPDFYLVVVFKNHESRKAFTDRLSLPDNCYVSAEDIEAKLIPQ